MQAVTLLETTPWLYITTCVIVGLCVGSFLNVVIHRMPRIMETRWRAECAELNNQELPPAERYNLFVPRSRCPACAHRIGALENIPLLSYIALGGKCSACRARISVRYPIVEAMTGALTGYIAWHFGFTPAAAAAAFFTWTMIALAFIDLDTFYLPDDLTLPLVWVVFWLFKLVTGKEGMGYGDFKLLAAIGAWLGWKILPLVILLSRSPGRSSGWR